MSFLIFWSYLIILVLEFPFIYIYHFLMFKDQEVEIQCTEIDFTHLIKQLNIDYIKNVESYSYLLQD